MASGNILKVSWDRAFSVGKGILRDIYVMMLCFGISVWSPSSCQGRPASMHRVSGPSVAPFGWEGLLRQKGVMIYSKGKHNNIDPCMHPNLNSALPTLPSNRSLNRERCEPTGVHTFTVLHSQSFLKIPSCAQLGSRQEDPAGFRKSARRSWRSRMHGDEYSDDGTSMSRHTAIQRCPESRFHDYLF